VTGLLSRGARLAAPLGLALCAVACGGHSLGGSSSGGGGTVTPANNVVSVSVSGGPAELPAPAVNTLYTTVTVCVPGTTTCQTIDNIQVDTGSYGLRILAAALTLSLPVATTSTGSALAECTAFVDGYSWGPLALVDMQISGETASSLPVQLIGDSRYPTVPADCSSAAPTSENTVASFGANGIIGIGPFAQDCGTFCASGIPEPAIYYACSTSSDCTSTMLATTSQVQNPVTLFATDNNGTIISLPSVADAGASNVTGSLIFGIGTQTNNSVGMETVIPVSTSGTNAGYLTTVFDGATLASSFIDSGSNAMYFNDSSLTVCTQAGFTNFYCPSSADSLSAAFEVAGGSTVSESFVVVSAETLTVSLTAFPGLAGTTTDSQSFDWGLPFFFGRQVATVIQGYTTADGTGPYIAF
jgi:Protein of unknown function (DUF3443)